MSEAQTVVQCRLIMMMETDKMDELDDDPDDGAGPCLYVTNTFHISATLLDLLI